MYKGVWNSTATRLLHVTDKNNVTYWL